MKRNDFKLIVISSADAFDREIAHVNNMFHAGMELFHLRKPKFSTGRLRRYLEKIDSSYHNRIVIHSHHELCIPFRLRGIHLTTRHRRKKYWRNWMMMKYIRLRRPAINISAGFHTLSDLKEDKKIYSYVFLSPIFDSISKVGYKTTFNEESLKEMLNQTSYNVIALGGVDESKISQAVEWGFSGVAVLGSIWKSADPVSKFKEIKTRCEQCVAV